MYFADVPLYGDRKLSQLIISKIEFPRVGGISGNLLYASLPFSNPARALCFSLFFPPSAPFPPRDRGGVEKREPECLYHNFMLYGFLQSRRS